MATGTKTAAWVVTGLAMALAAGTSLAAPGDGKGTAAASQPITGVEAGGAHGRHRKLIEPYGSMKTLTPDQAQKIEKIHADALEQEKKIRDKEADDIDALLTPAQKDELKAVETEKKDTAKEKAAARHKAGDAATTKPVK